MYGADMEILCLLDERRVDLSLLLEAAVLGLQLLVPGCQQLITPLQGYFQHLGLLQQKGHI